MPFYFLSFFQRFRYVRCVHFYIIFDPFPFIFGLNNCGFCYPVLIKFCKVFCLLMISGLIVVFGGIIKNKSANYSVYSFFWHSVSVCKSTKCIDFCFQCNIFFFKRVKIRSSLALVQNVPIIQTLLFIVFLRN